MDAPLLVAYTIGDEFAAAHTQTYDVGLGGLAMLGDTPIALVEANETITVVRGFNLMSE